MHIFSNPLVPLRIPASTNEILEIRPALLTHQKQSPMFVMLSQNSGGLVAVYFRNVAFMNANT